MESKYIQYGCGLSSPEGFVNFDASPTLRLERLPLLGNFISKFTVGFPKNIQYGDITKGLPLKEASCKGIYCSHVLEHLAYEECRSALKNTYLIMEEGAFFRLVLPDLEQSIRSYLEDEKSSASLTFLKEMDLGKERRAKGAKDFIRSWFGNSAHLWMWDYKSLHHELDLIGFKDIRRATFNDSKDKKFIEVENFDRWHDCLGIECTR